MYIKFTLLVIAFFQLSLLERCQCRPIFSYIFGESATSGETESAELEAISKLASDIIEADAAEVVDVDDNAIESGAAPVTAAVVQQPAARIADPAAPQIADSRQPQRSPLGNVGLPFVMNTVALGARTLNQGMQGAKSVIEGTMNLTTQAIGGVTHLGNGAFDNVQDMIHNGGQRTLDRFARWRDRVNVYRKGLSGTTAKNPERAHSVTITTASNAPVQTINDFISRYLPAGDGNLPEITSIDLSKLWYRR